MWDLCRSCEPVVDAVAGPLMRAVDLAAVASGTPPLLAVLLGLGAILGSLGVRSDQSN